MASCRWELIVSPLAFLFGYCVTLYGIANDVDLAKIFVAVLVLFAASFFVALVIIDPLSRAARRGVPPPLSSSDKQELDER
jgi:hypothetical protein